VSDAGRTLRALSPEQRQLVAQFIPLAERLWGHFLRQTRAYYMADDLRSIALEALHDGAYGYDPARGSFAAYAWRCIDGALSDALRKESKHWRAAREDAYDAADVVEDTSDVLADGDAETIGHIDGMADAFAAAPVLGLMGRALRAEGEEGERLRATYGRVIRAAESALSRLSEEERRVLVRHHIDGRTWQEVGIELGWPLRTTKRRGAEAGRRFGAALRAQREHAQGGAL
jgi:RNA polymerase sigma factor for flagellar operon FliA